MILFLFSFVPTLTLRFALSFQLYPLDNSWLGPFRSSFLPLHDDPHSRNENINGINAIKSLHVLADLKYD